MRGPALPWMLLAVCLVGGGGGTGWWLHKQAVVQVAVQTGLEQQFATLRQQLTALSGENTVLQTRLMAVERSAQVDQATQDAMRVRCSMLQDKLGQLEDEVAFYQSVLSHEDNAASIHASELKVRMRLSPQYFKYRITLVRSSAVPEAAEGIARLSLAGRQEDKAVTLSWGQINDQGQSDFRFKVKQMEVLEGDVHLPEGFIPARLKVELIPLGQAFTRQVDYLDWVVEQSGL